MSFRSVAPLFFGMAVLTGCTNKTKQAPPAETLVVPIAKPVERKVTDYAYFTGRTNAIESVNVVPRVTGYLTDRPVFKEGAEVEKGTLLFEVDPRPYQAQLDQAEGQVKLYLSQLKLAQSTLARDMEIAKTKGAVAAQQIDQDKAAVEEAEARVKAFLASTEVYKLNLEFTRIKSPIDGQVSRRYLTKGNLVNQDQTLLTTVVSLDPMYVYFDVDERTELEIREAINKNRIKYTEGGKIAVFMSLPGKGDDVASTKAEGVDLPANAPPGYPYEGYVDFKNNQVNPNTGSLTYRCIFPNPKPEKGVRLLAPGMFVRIGLPIGEPHPAVLVVDRAIYSDQGSHYVYVVNADSKVESRKVTRGALQDDGLREIIKGLSPDDWVVVGALQQVRANSTVKTEKIVMPDYRQAPVVEIGERVEPGKASEKKAKDAKK